MKKTLFLLALSAFVISCRQNVKTIEKLKIIYRDTENLDSSKIYEENGNWLCHQVDSATVAINSTTWYNQMAAAFPNDTISQVFVISASDLLRAIMDSPNVSEVIFYLAANPNDSIKHANGAICNATLYYAPARFVGRSQELKVLMYASDDSKTPNPYLFDNTVPCPTCLIMNGPANPNIGMGLKDTVIYSHKRKLHHNK